MIFKNKKYQKHFIAMFALFIYLGMIFGFVILQVMEKGQKWENVLKTNLTVELLNNENEQNAIAKIRDIDGVKVVRAVSNQEKNIILSKWLNGVDISKMPVASMIEVKIADDIDISELKTNILKNVPNSKVYSNKDWGQDISEITKIIFYMCVFLLCLMIFISIILINFLVQTLLNTYSREINILHLNGASDVFISAMIQKNIFIQSVKASFIGVLLSNITWLGLSYFFNTGYELNYNKLIDGGFVILVISIITAVFVKFNTEKELRA